MSRRRFGGEKRCSGLAALGWVFWLWDNAIFAASTGEIHLQRGARAWRESSTGHADPCSLVPTDDEVITFTYFDTPDLIFGAVLVHHCLQQQSPLGLAASKAEAPAQYVTKVKYLGIWAIVPSQDPPDMISRDIGDYCSNGCLPLEPKSV